MNEIILASKSKVRKEILNLNGINCKVFYKTAIGWIITCIIVGLTSALLISQGVYAPSVYKNTCSNISSF